jgi:hypothetical protein
MQQTAAGALTSKSNSAPRQSRSNKTVPRSGRGATKALRKQFVTLRPNHRLPESASTCTRAQCRPCKWNAVVMSHWTCPCSWPHVFIYSHSSASGLAGLSTFCYQYFPVSFPCPLHRQRSTTLQKVDYWPAHIAELVSTPAAPVNTRP